MAHQGWRHLNAPLLPPTLALITGICLGQDVPVTVSVIFLGVLVAFLLIFWRWHKARAKLLTLAGIICVGSILVHVSLYPRVGPHHVAIIPDRHQAVLTGTISAPPVTRDGNTVFYMLAEGNRVVPTTGMVRLTIKSGRPDLRYGYRVRVTAKMYRPRNFGNPGAFDYEGYLRRKGVLITGYVRSPDHVEVLRRDGGNPLLRWFDRRRQEVVDFLDRHTSPPGRGLLKALLIGEREEITKDIRDAFIGAGAVHILAISGLHLGIIVTLIFFSTQYLLKMSEHILLRYNLRKITAMATLPPLLFYIFITGCPISTIFT